MSDDTRVINTPDLNVLWRKAGRGKRPSKEWLDTLDPQGVHTLYVVLPFMQDGVEHRCRGFAKVAGREEGVEFEIDLLVVDFNRLQRAETLLAQARAQEEQTEEELLENGRRLASERENLIAQGVDPADLAVPIAPLVRKTDG